MPIEDKFHALLNTTTGLWYIRNCSGKLFHRFPSNQSHAMELCDKLTNQTQMLSVLASDIMDAFQSEIRTPSDTQSLSGNWSFSNSRNHR